MNRKGLRHVAPVVNGFIVCLLLAAICSSVYAQSATADADGGQKRLKRARALIAAHKLDAAATELNSLRTTTTDDSVRDVARIMLMNIYLEDGQYMRAQVLLEETYKARAAQSESSTRTYFALAGQAVNSSREHIGRYRSFGVNIADKELPAEAANDLDHMRMLLERIAEQARDMSSQSDKSYDGLGLLEAAASVRCSLSRTNQDRVRWQREVAEVRQKLATAESSIGGSSGRAVVDTTTNTPSAGVAGAPNHSMNTSAKRAPETPAAPAVRQTATSAPTDNKPRTGPDVAKPRNIGSLIEMATERISPSYPQTAKMARVTGVVTVYLEVDESGKVSTVQRTNGPQLLKGPAEDAARRWKFKPTVIEGHPVRVSGFINFNFTL